MLEMADELAAIRRELKSLRERRSPTSGSAESEGELPHERPPHY